MLSADDRLQVVEWSKRQLGNNANLSFVIESHLADTESMVEKSGTGLRVKGLNGCMPMLSIMADSAQCLSELHEGSMRYSDSRVEFCNSVRKPTRH